MEVDQFASGWKPDRDEIITAFADYLDSQRDAYDDLKVLRGFQFTTGHLPPAMSGRTKSPTPSTTLAPQASRTNNNTKEPFGLTTVFHPAEAEEILAHVVFVHGLGGGSEHVYKRRRFLASRPAANAGSISKCRHHTFGFDSALKNSSTLNLMTSQVTFEFYVN
jgi:hypothetical protein